MVDDLKGAIKRHLLLLFILVGIPSLTFWGLFFTANLRYMTYITNSMAGWLTILFLAWIEVSKYIKSKVVSIIIGMVSIYIAMFVVYYSFNWISQTTSNITLTTTHLAEAGFSFIFGVCVALSFRLMIYRDKEKDWGKIMDNLKYEIKDFFRIYGYYFATIFIILGIVFFVLSEIARSEVDINIYAEMYSNLWLTAALGFITIGIAFISIKIAIDSDYKINNISNANFLSVLSRFEDRRLDLQIVHNLQEQRYPNIVIWKALVDAQEMEQLLEFCDIKEEHQRRFITLNNQFLTLINENNFVFFQEGVRQEIPFHNILRCEGVKHLLQICNFVLNLKYQFDDQRDELFNQRIRILFNEPAGTVIDEQYIDMMIEYTDNCSNELFLECREEIKETYLIIDN